MSFLPKFCLVLDLHLNFQLFVIFSLLLGLIDDKMMKDFFRYAIVLIFIIAAILTPPDVISQILMAAPLILLYGISILIVRAVNPAPKQEALI